MIVLSIAKDFSKTPGFRYKSQSPATSGEQFREELLQPKYLEAVEKKDKLEVILDGTDGYLTSFLEEAFGGLQRIYPKDNILEVISIISNEEKHWVDDIKRYAKEALAKSK
jgi:hypothetical protein